MHKYFIRVLLTVFALQLLTACGEREEKKIALEDLTPLDVISYLKAHPPLDTASVKIAANFDNLIKVKKTEKKLFDKWMEKYSETDNNDVLNIWSRFGVLIDAISLEFKIIEFMELNPRIIFFKKELFYRELGLSFNSFANAEPFFQLVQNHLGFVANLLKHYSREQIKQKLNEFFQRHPELNEEDREALSFDLLRWYRLEESGIVAHPAENDSTGK